MFTSNEVLKKKLDKFENLTEYNKSMITGAASGMYTPLSIVMIK